jgi:hypothetical protein
MWTSRTITGPEKLQLLGYRRSGKGKRNVTY